jgi:hypothetical protein
VGLSPRCPAPAHTHTQPSISTSQISCVPPRPFRPSPPTPLQMSLPHTTTTCQRNSLPELYILFLPCQLPCNLPAESTQQQELAKGETSRPERQKGYVWEFPNLNTNKLNEPPQSPEISSFSSASAFSSASSPSFSSASPPSFSPLPLSWSPRSSLSANESAQGWTSIDSQVCSLVRRCYRVGCDVKNWLCSPVRSV